MAFSRKRRDRRAGRSAMTVGRFFKLFLSNRWFAKDRATHGTAHTRAAKKSDPVPTRTFDAACQSTLLRVSLVLWTHQLDQPLQ